MNDQKLKRMFSVRNPLLSSVLLLVICGAAAMAQDAPLSAKTSNPETLGWMQGFPPLGDRTIRFTDPDYFAFPKLRWTVCHFRELMPNTAVRNAPTGADALPVDLDTGLDAVTFTPLGTDGTMTWNEAFDANYTDAILVLHQGRIVYERYGGCMGEHVLHGAMSVTKSITGLIGEALVAEGQIDETAPMGGLIPELSNSAFGDATVQQVLEMTTALDYSEDYADPDADVWTYAQAGSPLPPPEGYAGPRSYFGFLETVEKDGEHGEAFGYRTINSDALGWLIARTTGLNVADWLAQNVWTRIGTEREAFYTVDSIGTPFAGGGFNATLRDMGRLGQLILNNGEWQGERILPAKAIDRIRQGGDPAVFARAGYNLLPGWSYRGMWWVTHDDHGSFAARGVHGQTIWIDPTAEMVIVRFASTPVAGNAASDPTSLPAYRAVADYLMAQEANPQLQGRDWMIEDIDGRGVIDGSPASLTFGADGQLSGNATCNRIVGSYREQDGRVTLGPVGMTMMACPEALMEQERRLLDVLTGEVSFDISKDGDLVLRSGEGRTLTARRR